MKILVIVNMQNDFTTGALGNAECEAVVPKIIDVINSKEFDKYILTRDTHDQDYFSTQEGKNLPVEHCIRGTYGWRICEGIVKAIRDKGKYQNIMFVDKESFGSLYLANLLKETYFIEQENVKVVVVGVCTGICVISNVLLLKAALPEAKITVLADACACVTPESHRKALDVMKMCQISIE